MRSRFTRTALMWAALLLPFASLMHAQKHTAPFPRDGATKVLENDYFAIWDVTYQKGQSTGMHQLPLDQVFVFMTEGPVKFTKPDGTWTIEQEKMGSVRYDSKGTIQTEALVGDTPVRAMIFQLKDDKVPPKVTPTPGVPDKFPRPGTVKLFETDRVVIWDYTWLTGMKTPAHNHYHVDASVYLVPGKTQVVGSPNVTEWKVGRVNSGTSGPMKEPHVETQVEGEPRAISIALK